jgi:hypothetical protein
VLGYSIEGNSPSNKSAYTWEVSDPDPASLLDVEDDHEFYRDNFLSGYYCFDFET